MSQATDVLIVGGGIVGAACALTLARRGRRVVLIEKDAVGSGATAAGMGHLVVMDDSEAQLQLTHRSRELWNRLGPELPADAQYHRCGTLWVAADEAEMVAVRSKAAYYRERQVRMEILDGKQLAEAEPNLRPGLAGALFVPDDGVVYPPCVARHFLEQAKPLGAEAITGEVVRLEDGAVVSANGARHAAKAIVLAGGAESIRLLPELPVRPRKGHLVITDRYPDFVRHQLVELGYLKSAHGGSADSVAFNVQPRPNGQLLLGSSRQYGATDPAIDPPMLERMLRRAFLYMPELRGLRAIRAWTGFRAATPDKLPLIGPHPARPGLWLATGHEGLGITTALGTAELLAAQLCGGPAPFPAEPYLPSRPFAEESHG